MLAALPLALSLAAAPAVELGYFGELATHPGLFAGAELPLVEGPHEVFTAARLAAYLHPGHHLGLLGRAELGYRATADFGLFGEARLGLGAHHRVLDGPVVTAREGALSTGADLGQLTFQPGLGLGVGWATPGRGLLPGRWFLRGDYLPRAPVNAGLHTSLALSLGVSWTLD